jgi:hypothetical protein
MEGAKIIDKHFPFSFKLHGLTFLPLSYWYSLMYILKQPQIFLSFTLIYSDQDEDEMEKVFAFAKSLHL